MHQNLSVIQSTTSPMSVLAWFKPLSSALLGLEVVTKLNDIILDIILTVSCSYDCDIGELRDSGHYLVESVTISVFQLYLQRS